MHKNDWWKWSAFALAVASMTQPACSSKAVGVEECRRIEYARCEAAPRCPDEFDVTDVELCKLFYRDQCLHGLPLSAAPKSALVTTCVNAIQQLSACARDGVVALETCPDVTPTDPTIATVCKQLATPEAMAECAFLQSEPTATGGQAGSSGQATGGAGGSTTTSAATTGGTTASTTTEGVLDDLLGLGGLTF